MGQLASTSGSNDLTIYKQKCSMFFMSVSKSVEMCRVAATGVWGGSALNGKFFWTVTKQIFRFVGLWSEIAFRYVAVNNSEADGRKLLFAEFQVFYTIDGDIRHSTKMPHVGSRFKWIEYKNFECPCLPPLGTPLLIHPSLRRGTAATRTIYDDPETR